MPMNNVYSWTGYIIRKVIMLPKIIDTRMAMGALGLDYAKGYLKIQIKSMHSAMFSCSDMNSVTMPMAKDEVIRILVATNLM